MASQVKHRSGKAKTEEKVSQEPVPSDNKGKDKDKSKKEDGQQLAGDKFGPLGIKKNDQLWSRYADT